MNLYIFNETRRGAVYGVGTYIKELTGALQTNDMNVCVINLFSETPCVYREEVDGIAYWHFPSPIQEQRTLDIEKQRALYFRNVVYLLRLHILDREKLIFHLNYHQNRYLVEELKEAFDNCQVISVAHFSDWGFVVFDNLQQLRNILKEKISSSLNEKLKKSFEEEKLYYSKVDHTICLSEYMQDVLRQDYNLDTTKISIIPNGLSDVSEMSSSDLLLRKKWHLRCTEKILLFVGRVDEIKGISFLIKAFREVLKINLDCRLIIAGNGNYDLFLQDAQDICMKITFTGFLNKKELYELYQIADVGVVPSLFEPFGYVPVEMMMHKLPIVATATSGLNEVVDENCALKVPLIRYSDRVEIDIKLLAEKILYILSHPKEARKLGENGRKRYEQMYTSEIFGQKMIQFYQSL